MAFRHVRRHWKKYLAGQCLGILVGSYLTRKYRERNVIREYCNIARTFGEVKVSMLERPKKILVFLNKSANKLDAKIQFNKYAAPLLNLSGFDVTVVESEYQGHIQTLMHYIDPQTDGIVVAGGDGTVMEVLNGLMRRQDVDAVKSIPVGILPLGRENRTFKNLYPSWNQTSQARCIGEATLGIIRGLTKQVPVLEIQPHKGRTLFALSSIQWGAFKDALEKKDSFRIFGKLRVVMSHLNTALRHWPEGHYHSLWIPQSVYANTDTGGTSPPTRHPFHPAAAAASASEQWHKMEEGLAAFQVGTFLKGSGDFALLLRTWPLTLLSKSAFIKHGWCRTCKKPEQCEVPGKDYESPEIIVVPRGDFGQGWLSVDGEEYESVTMTIKLCPNRIIIFKH